MKFTLIGQHPVFDDFTGRYISKEGSKITVEFEADALDDVLLEMHSFISGCGFVTKGDLEFIDNSTKCGSKCESCDCK